MANLDNDVGYIIIFRSITTLCRTHNTSHNIPHTKTACGKYMGIFYEISTVLLNIVMNLNNVYDDLLRVSFLH